MTMDIKDMLLGSRNFRIKTVTVHDVWDPEAGKHVDLEVGIRQPTFYEAEVIKAESERAKTPEQSSRIRARMAVACACWPTTGEPMFQEANMAVLAKNQVAGGWMSTLTNEILKYIQGAVIAPCSEPVLDVDGKPVLGPDGKPKLCGCEPVPNEPFCPRCGHEVPGLLEQAKRS